MARTVNLNKTVIDEFPAFREDMFEKISGLTKSNGDFEINVFYNKTLDPLSVNIGEYGTTGSYWVEFTPDKLGFWEVEVKIKSTDHYWYETFDVIQERDLGSVDAKVHDIRGTVVWNTQRDELVAMAWMTRHGETVKVNGVCYWKFYDSDNNLLFELEKHTPFSTGIYRIKKGQPNFTSEENYYYTCSIYDGTKLRESALGFITII